MINATNANAMKEKNRRLVLDLIRQGPCSRADIAKRTTLSKAAVSIIVEDLLACGKVLEDPSSQAPVGRRPIPLRIRPDALLAIGINLTRSGAQVGIADLSGRILCEKQLPALSRGQTEEAIRTSAWQLLKEEGLSPEQIAGVGIAAPGPLDSEGGVILNPPGFAEWHGAQVFDELADLPGEKIYLENVSGGLALCEKFFGVAQDFEDFLLLNVSDGIGSGIFSGGRLLRSAAEFGHTSIHHEGRPCQCGNRGCVEGYASVPAILAGTPYRSWQEAAKDEEILEKEAEYLSCAMINAANLFGFEHILLDGEVGKHAQGLIPRIEGRLARNSILQRVPHLQAATGFPGVLCGAVSVFFRYFQGD